MTYDFYLFEPDRDVSGSIEPYEPILSKNPDLVARFQRESADTTELLEKAAKVIREKIAGVNTSFDRTVVVPVAYGQEQRIEPWLKEVAVQHGLGLATDSDIVICYGDNTRWFNIETPDMLRTKLSGSEILANPNWLKGAVATNLFLILGTADSDQIYVQCCNNDLQPFNDQTGWAVEYREGSEDRHFQCHVDTPAEVVEIMQQWLKNDPTFYQHPWEKLRF